MCFSPCLASWNCQSSIRLLFSKLSIGSTLRSTKDWLGYFRANSVVNTGAEKAKNLWQKKGEGNDTVDGSLKFGINSTQQLRELGSWNPHYLEGLPAPSRVVGNGISAINSTITWIYPPRGPQLASWFSKGFLESTPPLPWEPSG